MGNGLKYIAEAYETANQTLESLAKKKKIKWGKPPGWTEKSVGQYSKKMMGGKEHPFASCLKKMKGKVKDPEAFCAKLKDVHKGSTKWRKTDRKANKESESIVKTAQVSPVELMSKYVALLRAIYLLHQRNHWEAKQYSNHLLFQRLYEGTQEMLDEAAEKTMGLYGELKVYNESAISEKFYDAEHPMESSLKAEKAFQDFAKKLYDALKKSDQLTLGLDDMIMSQVSKSELHCYLLQQAALMSAEVK
jgi:DNA-binding ferritin-like protein